MLRHESEEAALEHVLQAQALPLKGTRVINSQTPPYHSIFKMFKLARSSQFAHALKGASVRLSWPAPAGVYMYTKS
jgi:hypothetical protein